MTSKLALFALFYWFFLFLTCFLGGKLGFYHKASDLFIRFHQKQSLSVSNKKQKQPLLLIIPEFASKKIEHQNKSDYKCLLFIE